MRTGRTRWAMTDDPHVTTPATIGTLTTNMPMTNHGMPRATATQFRIAIIAAMAMKIVDVWFT
jgi:hypothetical protein